MRTRTEDAARGFTVVAPDRRKHVDTAIELLAKVFSGGPDYYRMRDWCREAYVLGTHYDWDVSRIGMIGDTAVTHWGVWDYQMRIGSARVRAGGVGGVATDADHRKKGLMDNTARASLEAMRAQGYDVSLLFGIDDFYHRFGYVRAWSDMTIAVRVWDLPKGKPSPRVRGFKPRPERSTGDLYNRTYAKATGTAVRPTYPRRHNPWFELPFGYKWLRNDRLDGYVLLAHRGTELVCGEYCGDDDDVLLVLAALCRKWNCREVRFESGRPNAPLMKRLRWGSSRIEVSNRRNGGPLIALLNLPSALGKMEKELSRRLRASSLADWEGNLLVAGPREQAMLVISGCEVRVSQPGPTRHAVRGGDEIVQLLIGTDAPKEVIEAGRMRVTGDAARLAEALFPAQYPMLGQPDRF